MAMAVEAALTAAELLDVGWSRLTRSKTRAQEAKERQALEDRALIVEGELARERLHAKQLQAALDEYKHVLQHLQSEREAGLKWLGQEASTEAGTADLLRKVEEKVNSASFLERLMAPPMESERMKDGRTDESRNGSASEDGESSRMAPIATKGASVTISNGLIEVALDDDTAYGDESSSQDSRSEASEDDRWQWVTPLEMRGGVRVLTEECVGLDGEEAYEVVHGDDVVDGIALVLARYIATHPEFQGLSAEELQKAVSVGVRELCVKGVMRSLWDWSKFVYKASRWTAAAYNVYRHPLVVRAVLMALIASTRVVLGFKIL